MEKKSVVLTCMNIIIWLHSLIKQVIRTVVDDSVTMLIIWESLEI